jgi:hypothetical protein
MFLTDSTSCSCQPFRRNRLRIRVIASSGWSSSRQRCTHRRTASFRDFRSNGTIPCLGWAGQLKKAPKVRRGPEGAWPPGSGLPNCTQRALLLASTTKKPAAFSARATNLNRPAQAGCQRAIESLAHVLRGALSSGADPIQHQKCADEEGKDAIQGIADGVRMAIHGEKHRCTEQQSQYPKYNARHRHRQVKPASASKPFRVHCVPHK